jgi:hypothetical protein
MSPGKTAAPRKSCYLAVMALQNRVTPFGRVIADPARGLFMGNRGGRIHDPQRRLTMRRWASQQWICCALEFKNRRREVWGDSYTELFLLDEVTAFAAGHRPCFECRRSDAMAFTAAWERACGHRPRAAQLDAILHRERLVGREKRTHRRNIRDLPDATMITHAGSAFAVRGDAILRWSPSGYAGRDERPLLAIVDVLTPPSIVAVLAAGYAPRWHPSGEGAPVAHGPRGLCVPPGEADEASHDQQHGHDQPDDTGPSGRAP